MKTGLIPHRLALAAALALSSCGVFAGELHALSESEMSSVYGRGLSASALDALGALTTKEQSSSGLSAADALAALGALSADRTQVLDHQLAQQRFQATADGVEATVKLAQSLAVLDKALLPIASVVTLPFLMVPVFGLPSPATLEALQHKH
jgi:hypothetical protein